ncbi:MAG: nitrilase-related carbon-nitrogen hydrolase [Candidatus Omnitrophota bacterium]
MLIILFNSVLAQYIVKRDRVSLMMASLLLSIFLFSHIFSMIGDPVFLHNPKKAKKVALIQGDVPRGSIFGYKERLDKRIDRYIGLSEEVRGSEADLVVWPEFTFPIDVMKEFPKKMEPVIDEIKKTKAFFIIGSLLTEQDKEQHDYNSALVFGRDGELEDIYYSQEPTIFNENISSKDNHGKLYLDNMGITLCWEEIDEKIFREYVSNGAEYFVSLSSNTDLDYSWFKRYASFFSRARAAESMRYLARTTQTGITQIINPFGKIVQRLPSNCSTFLIAEAFSVRQITFYSRYGDIVTKILVIFMILCVFVEKLWKKWRAKLRV